jgi:hypothetical protein
MRMDIAGRWFIVILGSLFFLSGFAIIRFRVRIAAWQQARNEFLAPFKSGPLGPGRVTPLTELVVGIAAIVGGGAAALLSILIW